MHRVHPHPRPLVWYLGAAFLLAAPLAQAEAPLTAEQVIARAEETFRGVTDYECVVETESHLASKVEVSDLRFRFKKPMLLRVNVLRGHGKGSEVVLGADGKVHAHDSGWLRAIVVTFPPDDAHVKSIRGVPLSDLVWGSFYRRLREEMSRPGARVALAPHGEPDQPYEVEVSYPEAGMRVRQVYRFDPHLWVMVEGDTFEDGVRVNHARFRDIRLNPGLKDSLFRL